MSHRLQWTEVPTAVREEIARVCGSPVVEAVSQAGGYGPGLAATLVFEDVDGRLPTTPWDRGELEQVVAATVALADVEIRAPLPTVAGEFGPLFDGWRVLTGEAPDAVDDPWCRARLVELAEVEARWEDAAAGDQLVHGDLRSDNILITGAGEVVFVDWSSSCVGAAWFDLVCMLPSIELEGGGAPESVLELAGFSDVDPSTLLPARSRLTEPQ